MPIDSIGTRTQSRCGWSDSVTFQALQRRTLESIVLFESFESFESFGSLESFELFESFESFRSKSFDSFELAREAAALPSGVFAAGGAALSSAGCPKCATRTWRSETPWAAVERKSFSRTTLSTYEAGREIRILKKYNYRNV